MFKQNFKKNLLKLVVLVGVFSGGSVALAVEPEHPSPPTVHLPVPPANVAVSPDIRNNQFNSPIVGENGINTNTSRNRVNPDSGTANISSDTTCSDGVNNC